MNHAVLIAPAFNGYNELIATALSDRFSHVTSVEDRPNSLFHRFVRSLSKNLYQKLVVAHWSKVTDNLLGTDVNLILVVKGAELDVSAVKLLKTACPEARMINYQWDSVERNPVVLAVAKYFDEIYTFDRHDSKIHGFTYLPLFYVDHKIAEASPDEQKPFDVVMVAEFYPDSDRLTVAKLVEAQCTVLDLNACINLRVDWIASIKFLYRGWLRIRDLTHVKLGRWPQHRIYGLYRDSVAVLDIEHTGQTGLTIRTLGALASGNKLITTNETITEEDIFNENMIMVISRVNPQVDKNFFLRPHVELDLKRYELNAWLGRMLSNEP